VNTVWLADQAGVTAKTIRRHETIGLMPEPVRADKGYRDYDDKDLRLLNFIVRARTLDFGLGDVKALVALRRDRGATDERVEVLAIKRRNELDDRIRGPRSIRDAPTDLIERCRADGRPDCPVLENLAKSGLLSAHG